MSQSVASDLVERPFARSFARFGTDHPAVVCVNNDLATSSEADEFRRQCPERFFALGMAEQNLIGVAAGMAREGWLPFYPTFGVFGTRRPYEQIAMSVAVSRLPVRIIGLLPGLTTPGGVTHQAIDDIGLMRMLPNMTVLDLGDATEIETVWPAFESVDGPVYCRLLRGDVPRLFESPFQFGRARLLRTGSDALVLSSGVATQWAIPAVARLAGDGIETAHAHVSTLKPFDDPLIRDLISAAERGVVTVENHLVEGGLGTAVATLIAEAGLGRRLVRLGLRDVFGRGGTLPYLLDRYGLSSHHIAQAVRGLLSVPDAAIEPDALPVTRARPGSVAEGL